MERFLQALSFMRYVPLLVPLALALALAFAPPAAAESPARPFTPDWAPPRLEVSPDHGRAGTRIYIGGHEFGDDVRAFYGDQPMRIVYQSEDEIVAVVPRDARWDDHIYVVDETGRARTAEPFILAGRRDLEGQRRWEEPGRAEEPPWREERRRRPSRRDLGRAPHAELEVSPADGPPGTRVRITGTRFGPNATPYYGERRMRVLRRSSRVIVAEIPRGAREDRYIHVVDPARTQDRFQLRRASR